MNEKKKKKKLRGNKTKANTKPTPKKGKQYIKMEKSVGLKINITVINKNGSVNETSVSSQMEY